MDQAGRRDRSEACPEDPGRGSHAAYLRDGISAAGAFPLWKAQLADGRIDAGFAAQGRRRARAHPCRDGQVERTSPPRSTTARSSMRCGSSPIFSSRRTAIPMSPRRSAQIADGVATSRIALMQGDISPKNILCGPGWPGVPGCGNGLLRRSRLRSRLLPQSSAAERRVASATRGRAAPQAFYALKAAYLDGAILGKPRRPRPSRREAAGRASARAHRRQIAGRISDGRTIKEFVRAQAKAFLKSETLSLDAIIERWTAELKAL